MPKNSAPIIIKRHPTEIKSKIRKKTACTVFLLAMTISADPTVIIEKK
jgi:hypothetical protein